MYKHTLLFTLAAFLPTACDQTELLDGTGSEQTCPVPDGDEDTGAMPGNPGDDDGQQDPPARVEPEPRTDDVHDVEVTLGEIDQGAEILVEFRFGGDHTGAVYFVRGLQTTIELVQDGQTIAALDVDMVKVRDAAQAGIACNSAIEGAYEVVFADAAVLEAAARDGGPLVHAIAMQTAIAADPELGSLLSAGGIDALDCEAGCGVAGSIIGNGVGAGAAVWCCAGTIGAGCVVCAGGAGAGGSALGGLITMGCKGLFC
jgi:hypothetical protein